MEDILEDVGGVIGRTSLLNLAGMEDIGEEEIDDGHGEGVFPFFLMITGAEAPFCKFSIGVSLCEVLEFFEIWTPHFLQMVASLNVLTIDITFIISTIMETLFMLLECSRGGKGCPTYTTKIHFLVLSFHFYRKWILTSYLCDNIKPAKNVT